MAKHRSEKQRRLSGRNHKMKITWLGHASFKIEEDGKIVFVDPWLSGPTSPITVDDVDKADIVLVTHDHGDHGYAEALGICKNTGATFVAINRVLELRRDLWSDSRAALFITQEILECSHPWS